MSTANRVTRPELVEGERLDQPEFHRRYEAMPPGVKAELIGGVVYMPSPVGLDHSQAQVPAIAWLSYYAARTPGVQVNDNATTILGWRSEPQPDASLRILPECGGQTTNENRYINGAPELVVEIAKASRYLDLGPKVSEYERAGVQEYVVRAVDPDELLWFRQAHGSFVEVAPDADGLYRSLVFPGLILDPQALLSGDVLRLMELVDLGRAAPEHAAFVAKLEAKRAEGR